MMDGRLVLVRRGVGSRMAAAVALAVLALPAAAAEGGSSDARSPFVGSWKPVSAEVVDSDGAVQGQPFGARPAGKLTYTAGGHMFALIARRDTPRNDPSALWHSGTFSVNPRRRTVILHVQYSTVPAFENTDVVRSYRFRGSSTLLLWSAVGDGRLVITWKRVRGRP
jgi:hypothetical protein